MKAKFLLLAAFLFAAVLSLSSFRGHDRDDLRHDQVPAAVVQTFERMYPGVRAQWEKDDHQYKAEFHKGRAETEAWFKKNGTWTRTETDIHPQDLPAEVKDYVRNKYPNCRIDDAELVETPKKGAYYDLEIQKGHSEVNIKVDAKGSKRGEKEK